MALGFAGILIYFISRTTKRVISTKNFGTTRVLELTLALMSVTLFSRYLYHTFWDIPGVVIVPFYIGVLIFGIIRRINQDHKIITTNILFIILLIPTFGISFYKGPRYLIPIDWYDRYQVSNAVTIKLPWKFNNSEAHDLNETGFNFMKDKQYNRAIEKFLEALKFERSPELFFNLSECYARTNKLEIAIDYLDTLISVDSTHPMPFNNRGLLNYKLKNNSAAIQDYLVAIELDSNFATYHSNLALAYHYNKEHEKACLEFSMARELGSSSEYPKLEKISCEKNL